MKIAKQTVELIDVMGDDLAVVNAARVSFEKESGWEYDNDYESDPNGNPHLSEKDVKLITYLGKHGHWSPFAHTSLKFRISAPIFVARQLVKHQVGGVWNEVSRRYVESEPSFYFPDAWHGKPTNAKQGAGEAVKGHRQDVISSITEENTKNSLQSYNNLLHLGVAPEEARMVLPLNTMTSWIWTGSLVFFARVCQQRLDSHSQSATREIAECINKLIPENFKYSWNALMTQ